MMASIEKQLQNLKLRLRQENENQNGSTSSTTRNDMNGIQISNDNQKRTESSRESVGTQISSTVQQFPRRQYSLSATQRQPNSNLQLNLSQISNNRNNTSNTNVFNRHNGSHSQSLNAQCLSPRPRPRQLPVIIGNSPQGRPGSPSRAIKPMPLSLFPSNGDDFQPNSRNNKFNNEKDDKILNEKFNQNNSVLTVDGKKYSAQDVDLQYIDELGSGSCGHVVKMRHLPSGKVVAVKQMRRSGNKEENKRITMDLDILLACHDCPNIVQCYGYFIKDTEVWICMELMTTCFDKLLKKLKSPIPEPILGKISVATVKALNYLKDNHGVIHRDVKPSNILINEKGVVKLCDFGISGRLVDSKAKTRSAGCAAYMAPERIDPPDTSNPSYDIRADVWSLGITLVELATGKFPYHECRTDFEVLTKVIQEDPPSLPSDGLFSINFCSFVKSCLTKDYRKRPKYKKLLEHPFIRYYEKANVNVEQWFNEVMRSELLRENELSPIANI